MYNIIYMHNIAILTLKQKKCYITKKYDEYFLISTIPNS